jgi:hypothetical protein
MQCIYVFYTDLVSGSLCVSKDKIGFRGLEVYIIFLHHLSIFIYVKQTRVLSG